MCACPAFMSNEWFEEERIWAVAFMISGLSDIGESFRADDFIEKSNDVPT